jgi:hypothetical protein
MNCSFPLVLSCDLKNIKLREIMQVREVEFQKKKKSF